MYNSSIKGQNKGKRFCEELYVPHKIFFNDMSKNYMVDDFKRCDVVYSEISWIYGYKMFNERAENEPNSYANYLDNINTLIEELNKPSFIICGKNVKSHFPKAKMFPFKISTSGTNISNCTLYVWNYDFIEGFEDTTSLLTMLSKKFNTCLDFSCGYGEHLLKFNDFVGADINKDCLTYLTILYKEKIKNV